MSRAYMECGHYKVIYPDDTVWLGDVEWCQECLGDKHITDLPEGEQGLKSIDLSKIEAMDLSLLLKEKAEENIKIWGELRRKIDELLPNQ